MSAGKFDTKTRVAGAGFVPSRPRIPGEAVTAEAVTGA